MVSSRSIFRILFIVIVAALGLLTWPSLISRITSLRELTRSSRISLQYRLPWYSIGFNNVFPRPRATYTLISQEPKDGRNIPEGTLFIEIAGRPNDGTMPSDDKYHLLSLHPFTNLKPGQRWTIDISIPADQYPAGAYWLKPTLRLYSHHPSTLLEAYEKIRQRKKSTPGILDTWIRINVIGESGEKWKEERVLGSMTALYGPGLIEWYGFLPVSGLSLVAVYSLFMGFGKKPTFRRE